jgi:phage terminase large subunit-like protein
MSNESKSQSQISPAELLASLSEQERQTWLSSLTDEEKAELKYHWDFWARANQKAPPGDWNTWLVMAGRGYGKTRMGSEWIRQLAHDNPGCRIALVAETAADARDVMILGDSGLVNCDPTLDRDSWSPTNRCLTWPNGTKAWCYNATEPDQLRGPQHHFAWVDELAKFRYMQETWDQLQFGLRLGLHPRVLVTTTPRPLPLIKKLIADVDTAVTRGATLDNKANLAANTMKQLYERYGGTRLGRQELEGEILTDIPGALWNRDAIDAGRIVDVPDNLERVFVAVDPAVSNNEGSDEHGIVVVGLARDKDGYARGYVLEDGTLRGSPEDWAKRAVSLYRSWSADKIIAEKNQGGQMVESTIKAVDRSVPVELVHATRGKVVRAEPVSALYEQGRIHHVGRFDLLEDQMCMFSVDNLRNISNGSPDRVDALVWGLTKIFDKITGRRLIKEGVTDNTNTKYSEESYVISDWTQNSEHGWMA